MSDLIYRDQAIEAISKLPVKVDNLGYTWMIAGDVLKQIDDIPSAEPDNVEGSDVIFGNGIGHDNACACAKFEIKPERTAKVECIAEVYRNEIVDHYLSGICGICGESTYDRAKYCSECGAKLDWSQNE